MVIFPNLKLQINDKYHYLDIGTYLLHFSFWLKRCVYTFSYFLVSTVVYLEIFHGEGPDYFQKTEPRLDKAPYTTHLLFIQ